MAAKRLVRELGLGAQGLVFRVQDIVRGFKV
jgi:hypothetical protein